MAVTIGANGAVTSWGTSGDDCFHLIDTALDPTGFDLAMSVGEADVTALGDSVHGAVPTLNSVTGTIRANFPSAPKTGYTGLLTFSTGGYVVRARNVSLSITATVSEDIAAYTASGTLWSEFVPVKVEWSGSYQALIDDTTSLAPPTLASGALATLTVKLTEEGATDNTMSGPVIITSVSPVVERAAVNTVTYGFRGAGALTVGGSANVLPAGSLALPDIGELVLTAASGKTFSGDAFWNSLQIEVPVGDKISVTAGFTGTGAWSIA